MEYVQQACMGDCSSTVWDIGRNQQNIAGLQVMRDSIHDQFKFSFEDVDDLLVNMVVNRNRCVLFDRPVREGHRRGVDHTAMVAGNDLARLDFVHVESLRFSRRGQVGVQVLLLNESLIPANLNAAANLAAVARQPTPNQKPRD